MNRETDFFVCFGTGPGPAALARVAAERAYRQHPKQQHAGGSTSRPASGSVARSPVPAPPPEFPGFPSPTRPAPPAAAAAVQGPAHPAKSPSRLADQSPPPVQPSTAAEASAANGSTSPPVRPTRKSGPTAASDKSGRPDSAANFGYVYVPPPAPRPPRGLPRSPVRGMSSLDASLSGLRPVATVPVRSN